MSVIPASSHDTVISILKSLELKPRKKFCTIPMLAMLSSQLRVTIYNKNKNINWNNDVLPVLQELGFNKAHTKYGTVFEIETDKWQSYLTENTTE